jgi:predicted aspartyl protease
MGRLAALVLFIAVVAAAPHVAQAQSDLTVADVRAKIKAATGEPPPSETITATFTRGGQSGTEVRERSGDDFRVDQTVGPIATASGRVGGVAWRQNANGETIVNATEPDEFVSEVMITRLIHVTAPEERYVISRLSPLGRGTKEYVDPATWRIVRFETISATDTTVTTYADFHTIAGYTRAWSSTTSNGHLEDDATYTITDDSVAPVSAAALAIPKDRRTLVEFPQGQTTVTLPVRYDERAGKFIVRIMVGTRGLDFLIDSGSAGIAMDRGVAKSLGLTTIASYSNAANAGRFTAATVIVPSMTIGDLKMRDVVVTTTPSVGIPGDDFQIVGLLGFDFLRAADVRLDYAKGTATATLPSAFVPPVGDHLIDLDVRLASSIPETTVTINGAIGTRFFVDTGGVGALMINDYFRRRFPQAIVDESRRSATVRFNGVGGTFDAEAIQLKEIDLGGASFVHSPAYVVTTSRAYAIDKDGVIGPNLLRIFTVYLDLPHDKIYFVPGGK